METTELTTLPTLPMHDFATSHGTLRYVDVGARDAPVVLFVHGTPTSSADFGVAIDSLMATNRYRCIAPDHLGFGRSDKPANAPYSRAFHQANLAALLASLDVREATLVVHDVGGPIALPLVLDGQLVATKLVLINTWLWDFESVVPSFRWQKMMLGGPLARWLYRRWNFSARVITKQAWGTHRPLDPAWHAALQATFATPEERAGTLGFLCMVATGEDLDAQWKRAAPLATIPTLIVWGAADTFVPRPHLLRWLSFCKNAQSIELARVGHFPAVEAAEHVAADITAFLDGKPLP